jgi:hypothetical protein
VCDVAIAAGMAYLRIYILSVHQLARVDIRRTGEMYLRGNSSGRKIDFYLGRGQSAGSGGRTNNDEINLVLAALTIENR